MTTVPIYQLVQGAVRSMFLSQVKWAVAGVAVLTSLVLMSGGLLTLAKADDQPTGGLGTTLSTQQSPKTDQEKIQGKWYCVALALGGSIPDQVRQNTATLQDSWMEFIGDTFRLSGSPSEEKAVQFQLLTNVTPKQLVFDAGVKQHCIYSLEDGLLLVKFIGNVSEASDLPKSFALGQKSSGILFVMQRERLVQQRKAASNPGLGAMAQPTPLATTQANMKQIAIAVHNYANDYNHLPTNVYDKNGKAILSWRVKLLPYLEMDDVAKLFKMDEPWDSQHNKALLLHIPMPPAFNCSTSVGKSAGSHTTPFRAFSGKGTLHEFNKKFGLRDITDGTSNTFLYVEAAKAVPWTYPDDLEYDPAKPFPEVGGRFGNLFLAAFCDGSVRELPVPTNTTPSAAKSYFKMVTPAGGEDLDPETAK